MPKSKLLKNTFKKITKSPLFLSMVSAVLYVYSKFVWKTTKWQIHGLEKMLETWEKDQSIILVGWHGRATMMPQLIPFAQGKPMDALVSLHNDGQMIAGYLKKFGIKIIGGSSNNNAKGAAISLMRSLQKGRSITIIPDGPRGPRMKMSMSPLYYAQKTGKAIFTMTYSTNRAKIIEKAWDKMMVPLPFARGVYYISEPIYIPAQATDTEMESFRQELEKILNCYTWKADQQTGQPQILPQQQAKPKRYKQK